MPKWNWKRWVGVVLTGTAVAAGDGGVASADDSGLPKPNDSISLKFQGQTERKVTVIKSTRKPDGSVETEVKDTKTGETFTLIDTPPSGTKAVPAPSKPDLKSSTKPAADQPSTTPGRDPILPRAKQRADDPLRDSRRLGPVWGPVAWP